MKPFALALFLALLLSASGCSGLLIHQAMNPKDAALTPEQIEAYSKVGADVWSCLNVAGPPPAGSLVMITAPKTAKANIVFGDGCRVK
jgi:hypothetical protein